MFRTRCTLFALFLSALFLATETAGYSQRAIPPAIIVTASNSAKLTSTTPEIDLVENPKTPLYLHAKIETNQTGSIELILVGSNANLWAGPNSSLELIGGFAPIAGTPPLVARLEGRNYGFRQGKDRRPRPVAIEVQTKSGRTAYVVSKGTVFSVECDGDKITVVVAKGFAEFIADSSKQYTDPKSRLLIPEGYKSTTGPDGFPGKLEYKDIEQSGEIFVWTFDIRDFLPPLQNPFTALPQNAGTPEVRKQYELGLTLMRQPSADLSNISEPGLETYKSNLDAAKEAFRKIPMQQSEIYYAALSWKALIALTQRDNANALVWAKEAAHQYPSELTVGNLAVVQYFSRQEDAYDNAEKAKAWPMAQFLLALRDTKEKQGEAIDKLEQIAKSTPDFLAARRQLIRLLMRQNRIEQAEPHVRYLQQHFPDTDEALISTAELSYARGLYGRAIEHFEKFVFPEAGAPKPSSLDYSRLLTEVKRQGQGVDPYNAYVLAGLSRALLDSNRLRDAIYAGGQAVELQPNIGQYRAQLGLIYDVSGLKGRAIREYRTALSLDPLNALARIQLGLNSTDPGLRISNITQALMFDPDAPRQIFRGGIQSHIGLDIGSENLYAGSFSGWRSFQRYRTLFFLGYVRDQADTLSSGYTGSSLRNNQDASWITVYKLNESSENDALLLTNITYTLRSSSLHNVQPTNHIVPIPTDLTNTAIQVALKQPFGAKQGVEGRRHALWLGLTHIGNRSEFERVGSSDPSLVSEKSVSRLQLLVPEIRVDFALDHNTSPALSTARSATEATYIPPRPSTLTLGAGYTPIHSDFGSTFPTTQPLLTRNVATRGSLWTSYIQWFGDLKPRKLSLIAQLNQVLSRQKYTVFASDRPNQEPPTYSSPSATGYNVMATYIVSKRSVMRLFLNRQAPTGFGTNDIAGFGEASDSTRSLFGVTAFAFRPSEALTAVEDQVLPEGFPSDATSIALEGEYQATHASLVKLFGFYTASSDLQFGTSSRYQARRAGIGLRYERQLGRHLYASLFGMTAHSWKTQSGLRAGDDLENNVVPFQPDYLAELSFNWVDPSGIKTRLGVRHIGSFFLTPSQPTANLPDSYPARTYIDLRFAVERRVRDEFYVQISNLFNAPQVTIQGLPTNQRRFDIGLIHSF